MMMKYIKSGLKVKKKHGISWIYQIIIKISQQKHNLTIFTGHNIVIKISPTSQTSGWNTIFLQRICSGFTCVIGSSSCTNQWFFSGCQKNKTSWRIFIHAQWCCNKNKTSKNDFIQKIQCKNYWLTKWRGSKQMFLIVFFRLFCFLFLSSLVWKCESIRWLFTKKVTMGVWSVHLWK